MKLKLYTEEQIREAYNLGFIDGYDVEERCENSAISLLTPIELPSDDEIIKAHDAKEFQFISFWAGAAWCRNQILNQNK